MAKESVGWYPTGCTGMILKQAAVAMNSAHPEYKASLSANVAPRASIEATVVLVNIPLVPISIGVSVPNNTLSCPKKSIACEPRHDHDHASPRNQIKYRP